MASKQIKSRQRVADHGEVFTADREVNAMIDLIGPEIENISTTVLEPAVGEGAFLISILRRRFRNISSLEISEYQRKLYALKALSTLYGIDIQQDNVDICRSKLNDIIVGFFVDNISETYIEAISTILKRNIQCGNSLTGYTNTGRSLMFSEWIFQADGTIYRQDYQYNELVLSGGECMRHCKRIKYTWMRDHSEEIPIVMRLVTSS